MAEHEDWTADDDAQLRGAFATLREDVDAVPLGEVRFVRARGVRRRRQRALTLTAAGAAAAVVVGAVGYGQLGRDGTLPLVPATGATGAAPSTASTATPTDGATDALTTPGALPLVTDWTTALGLTGTARLTPVKPFEAVECLDEEPGTKVQQEGLTLDAATTSGGQVRFALASGTDPRAAASGVADDISDCALAPGFGVNRLVDTDAGSLYSYTAGGAGSGWFAIVHGPRDLAVLQVVDPDHTTPAFTSEQVESLATTAQQRLARYGTGANGSSTPVPVATAKDEQMPVTGPSPVPSSELFVAASQWTSPLFARGATAYAGPGDPQDTTGDIGVFCETSEYLAGLGGRLGEVEIRAGGGDADVIGHQRVRVDESADPSAAPDAVGAQVRDAQAVLTKGCTEQDGRVTVTTGPGPGTYLMTKQVSGGTAYRWVGVTALTTPGAWTTVVFHGTSDGQGFTGRADQGFAELDRLLSLARQK